MALGLLDGLATTISFRLSSRCSEGAGPSPDAMAVDVVFAGWACPLDALPTLISNAAACPSAGLDAMQVSVVFTGNPALTSGADEGLPVPSASSGRRAQSTHATPKMGGSSWPSAP